MSRVCTSGLQSHCRVRMMLAVIRVGLFMHCRATLVALCFSGFALAGCGAHLTAEGTTPASDASRSDRASLSDPETTGQTSAAPPPASGPIKIPRDFPANYRIRLAASLVGAYFREGRGTPEISDFQPSLAPQGINELCVQYPAAILGGTRRMLLWSTPSPLDASRIVIKKRDVDFLQSCRGTMYRFVELEQVAQKFKACQAKGEKSCVVSDDAYGRQTVVSP
jgi:hypothetical protein